MNLYPKNGLFSVKLSALLALTLFSTLSIPLTAAQAGGKTYWAATWISHPMAPLREPITLHFRRSFSVSQPLSHFIIRVSADNRFVLYLNGERIGDGPARGDLGHWRYETFDLGPRLHAGENTLSATVWNFGVYAPTAQMSDRTAFLVQGDTAVESAVDTNGQWMVETEPGHVAYPREPRGFWAYMATGPGEMLVASQYDWDWQTDSTAGGRWVHAASAMRENIYPGAGVAGSRGSTPDNPWQLVADQLPAMSYEPESAGKVVRSDLPNADKFPQQSVEIPANSHVHLLLDRGELTTAYPRLAFSGGTDAHIVLTYAEALYDDKQLKGDRDEVGTRKAMGAIDLILPDGGQDRVFEPLWWRTWRYLDIEVITQAAAVRLGGLEARFTAYPFARTGSFHSSDSEMDRIWQIGWHTLALDSHETFMDTPYYEQLQYVGDARVEAMIAYAGSPDDRLARGAIQAIYDSRRSDGLTESRYPTSLPQYIPPFSLLWIGMVHDFDRYHSDPGFVRQMLPGTRTVATWFASYQQASGLIAHLPDWSFVDWTKGGVVLPSYDSAGQSCLLTLQYAGALEDGIDLEHRLGDERIAQEYERRLALAKDGVMRECWDAKAGMIADSPTREVFSEHAQALAVLYDVVPSERQRELMTRVLDARKNTTATTSKLIPSSYYFDYYVVRALDHARLGDRYLEILKRWRGLLHEHFTTWPETPGDTRSDSHAWSAHPTYDLLTLIAGIAPASAEFATVRIEPHLGDLKDLDAAMPSPSGLIHVHYRLDAEKRFAEIDLPSGLAGTFVWNGRCRELHSGTQRFELER